MGLLIDGTWDAEASGTPTQQGRFVRTESRFRRFVTADGSSGFKAEPGRYHLYAAFQCPWAHRTILLRALKKLEPVIGISIAIPNDRREGWRFGDHPGAITDDVNGFTHLHQAYTATDPHYSGVVSVPVLWDRENGSIVNNESSDIIRMLNREFDRYTGARHDFYPEPLREEIDWINDRIYYGINNGVYRCGLAKNGEAYQEAFDQLFATLEMVEERLAQQRYLVGDMTTEADWRLFCTLIRFDAVYYRLFQCNGRTIASYPALSHYLRDLYQTPHVAETVNIDHIVRGYYAIKAANPAGVIPIIPQRFHDEMMAPHDRNRFSINR